MRKNNIWMKKALRYFLQGILIIVPIGLTFYIVFRVIDSVFSWFGKIGGITGTWIDSFLYLLFTVIFVLLIGLLGSTFIFRWFFAVLEQVLEKAPLVRIIYSSIKDFLSAFVGGKKRFNKPALVTLDKINGIQQIGFVTKDAMNDMGIKEDKVAVYFPMSYAFSGKLLIVPREQVELLKVPAAEAMKFIVSGGVSEID